MRPKKRLTPKNGVSYGLQKRDPIENKGVNRLKALFLTYLKKVSIRSKRHKDAGPDFDFFAPFLA